jgi:hypothetical protein
MKVGDKLYIMFDDGSYNIVQIWKISNSLFENQVNIIIDYKPIIEQYDLYLNFLIIRKCDLDVINKDGVNYGWGLITTSEEVFIDWLKENEK